MVGRGNIRLYLQEWRNGCNGKHIFTTYLVGEESIVRIWRKETAAAGEKANQNVHSDTLFLHSPFSSPNLAFIKNNIRAQLPNMRLSFLILCWIVASVHLLLSLESLIFAKWTLERLYSHNSSCILHSCGSKASVDKEEGSADSKFENQEFLLLGGFRWRSCKVFSAVQKEVCYFNCKLIYSSLGCYCLTWLLNSYFQNWILESFSFSSTSFIGPKGI